jgi:hypothetical protein
MRVTRGERESRLKAMRGLSRLKTDVINQTDPLVSQLRWVVQGLLTGTGTQPQSPDPELEEPGSLRSLAFDL